MGIEPEHEATEATYLVWSDREALWPWSQEMETLRMATPSLHHGFQQAAGYSRENLRGTARWTSNWWQKQKKEILALDSCGDAINIHKP